MNRRVLILILCCVVIVVFVPAFLFSLNWPPFQKVDNVDGEFLTATHLRWFSRDIVTYFKACSAAEWQETCGLTNSTDIWAAMGKKIDLYDKEQRLIDTWGDPYYFEVKRRPQGALIRIGSKGNGPPLNGRHMFIDLEFDAARKVITEKFNFDPTIETIEIPKKNDGWTLEPILDSAAAGRARSCMSDKFLWYSRET